MSRAKLGDRGDERGGWRWSTFVGIRRPEMEGDDGDLEAEAGNHQDPRHVEQRAGAGQGHPVLDQGQVGGAGKAVEIAEAEEQECRRHAAEEVILHGGFGAFAGGFGEGGENVEAEREQFETDEDDQQVLGRGYEQASGRGHQHHGYKFADVPGEERIEEQHERERGEDENSALRNGGESACGE